MKILKLLLGAAAIVCTINLAHAQAPETELLEEYASPGVRGMGKGKGIVIGYERVPQFDITSDAKDPRLQDGSGRVRRHNKFDVKLNAPILNKPQTKLIFGIDYKFEEFNFEDVTPAAYDLYEYLEDKNLQSIGAQVAYLHSIDNRRFYLVRLKGELNGDFTKDDINVDLFDYFKSTVDVAYGWKKSPDYAIGVALQFGYTFGRKSVYPAILYNRTYNDRWGVEAIFPANARVRYNVNDKTLLFAGYRLEGASYNLYVDEGPLSEFGEIELRRTDVKGVLRLEREIYDFLWFGVEGGFRQYYRNRIFDEVGSKDEILDNDLSGAGFVKFEIFVVPPRRFMEKNK
ncbi:DUF6268 family outer membrane beta-barrel protein [Pontibacter fetidus]|uniref:DUF6268 domain-containing protein n=1 Tax=Pontibacter fetidus TaxID=2700082 RepID=A0A6B2H127_9BACT|nr:DUF6268 family outer membrane beta-barrel protein [Pontibacter fetidus]NDK56805.1 hypothetical protein [Pontibacter fetidus]